MEKKIRTPIAAVLLLIACIANIIHLMIRQVNIYGQIRLAPILAPITVIPIVLDLVLCVMLFKKNRSNILCIVLGCIALFGLYPLVFPGRFQLLSKTVANLLFFAAYVLQFGLAMVLSEQTFIKADLSKFKTLGKKFYFLPAVLCFVGVVISTRYVPTLIELLKLISELLRIVAIFLLAKWLKDPYAKPVSETENRECIDAEAYCGLGKHIVLCLFTCGVWSLIWTYRTTKYLNNAPNAEQYNPTNKLLLCMFVPFYQIYWYYKHGQRIDAMSKQKNLNNSDMATLCLILGIFIPIVACILVQDRINTLCTTKSVAENN